jgi:hypothetical protein
MVNRYENKLEDVMTNDAIVVKAVSDIRRFSQVARPTSCLIGRAAGTGRHREIGQTLHLTYA